MLRESGERALLLAFTLSVLAATLGMNTLAAAFCSLPMLNAFMGVMTPAFLVSAYTVMNGKSGTCFTAAFGDRRLSPKDPLRRK